MLTWSPDGDEGIDLTRNFQDSKPRLFIKRRTQESDNENDYYTADAAESYDRLTNQARDDYLAASPVDPGLSVAGLLWSEVSSSHGIGHSHGGQDSLVWRDIQEIADDPDQVGLGSFEDLNFLVEKASFEKSFLSALFLAVRRATSAPSQGRFHSRGRDSF